MTTCKKILDILNKNINATCQGLVFHVSSAEIKDPRNVP
jgi:hypothetical protein